MSFHVRYAAASRPFSRRLQTDCQQRKSGSRKLAKAQQWPLSRRITPGSAEETLWNVGGPIDARLAFVQGNNLAGRNAVCGEG